MAHPDQTVLERFVDGELSRRRSREVASHLEGCDDCAAAVEALRGLGGLLRRALDERATEARLEGLADAVLDAVKQDRPLPWPERARTWVSEFLRHQKKVWVPPLAAAGAAAAALIVVVGLGGPGQSPDSQQAPLPPGSNVLSVTFGNSVEGSLFQLEGKDGSTTAVIWVDEGEDESDPEVKQT